MNEDQLIFIISQPRSGSTMLQAILSNNENVDTVSEPWLMLPFLSIYKPWLIKAKYDYKLALDAFWDFLEKSKGKANFENQYKHFLLNIYNDELSKSGNFFIDKTPRYYEIFDQIFQLFPRARFIILKRHPVAVLRSIINTWNRFNFKELNTYHNRDLFAAPSILQNIAIKYYNYENVMVCRYEDLIGYPDIYIKKIFEWIGLNYSINTLNINLNKKYLGKYGDPFGLKVYKKPNSNLIDNWITDLDNPKIKYLLNGYGHYLGNEFLQSYGYQGHINFKPNLKFKVFRYYCMRASYVSNWTAKDFFARKLINYFNETI